MRNIWLRKYGRDTLLLNDLPNLAHLSAYGCKGYILNEAWLKDTDRAARKNWPRTNIGYLIEYKDNSIRRFWVLNFKAKRTGYIVVETRDAQVDETVFYNLEPPESVRFLQPDPIVEIEDSDDDSDTGSIVSINLTAELQARNDLDDFEEEVDPFAEDLLTEDPFADPPDSPIDENVYTAPESLETPQKPLGRRQRNRQLFAAACKNLKQSGSVYSSALHY